jgi:uncharacterized protein YbaA (DUF1428 family)
MIYLQDFVAPVRTGNRPAYIDMAKQAAQILAEYGALRTVDGWGDDGIVGKVIDLRKAVQAEDDETVVLSWVRWPDRATCDTAAGKTMADERMKPDGELLFGGKREDIENGALRLVNGWGADVPVGKVTDFPRTVQAKGGETVIFGWIEWPDKPTRDAGKGAMMRDPRMRQMPAAWNGPLAIFGGFTPILDTDNI